MTTVLCRGGSRDRSDNLFMKLARTTFRRPYAASHRGDWQDLVQCSALPCRLERVERLGAATIRIVSETLAATYWGRRFVAVESSPPLLMKFD